MDRTIDQVGIGSPFADIARDNAANVPCADGLRQAILSSSSRLAQAWGLPIDPFMVYLQVERTAIDETVKKDQTYQLP